MIEPVKPVDLEAIRKNTADYCDNYVVLSPGLKQALNIDIPALCDEVEALRERVKEMEEIGDHYQFKWATLKDWLIRDKENGSGHKVSRALFLIAELENQPKEIER